MSDDKLLKETGFLSNNSNGYYDNDFVSIVVSVVLGIILAIILYRGYIRPPITRGPNSRDIVDKIFKVNDKYYELEPVVCGCLLKKNLID